MIEPPPLAQHLHLGLSDRSLGVNFQVRAPRGNRYVPPLRASHALRVPEMDTGYGGNVWVVTSSVTIQVVGVFVFVNSPTVLTAKDVQWHLEMCCTCVCT